MRSWSDIKDDIKAILKSGNIHKWFILNFFNHPNFLQMRLWSDIKDDYNVRSETITH